MWYFAHFFPLHPINFALQSYVGWTLIFLGFSLDIISFFNFRKNKTTINPLSPEKATYLVVDGFYRYTRNPMYLGMLLVLLGSATLFGSLSPLLIVPLFVFTITKLQIEPEETALKKIFGEQYLQYKKRIRRWL